MAFQKRIDNLEKKFYLTIEGYKNAYIQKARENTSESNNIFNQAEGSLNNVFSDLIQLKAEIHNTISANKESIAQGNVQITEAKNSWDKSKKELEKEYSTNLASNPLKHNTNTEKNSTYLTNLFYVLGLVTLIGLTIKQFKSSDVPTSTGIPVAKAVPVRI